MPDILAFSDTRVNENSPIRPLDGYHNFNFTPTPTGAGGVGFYLKDVFDYDLRPDLKLNLNLCEDIWFNGRVSQPKYFINFMLKTYFMLKFLHLGGRCQMAPSPHQNTSSV